MSKDKKTPKGVSNPEFKPKTRLVLLLTLWLIGLTPLFGILYLRYITTDNANLPSTAILESQEESLATTIFADDGITELGKYWKVNRTSVSYHNISPYAISALISTEDERFEKHAGIDAKAVARALYSMGEAGGASTISQQLAKLIFTLQEREDKAMAQLQNGENQLTAEEEAIRKMGKYEKRLYEKVKENVIALRLERRYTKREIITMYLNQFDFLFNAVGISSAARVYFNKAAAELQPEEAAMLIGMCKNPSYYNPYMFKIKNYRGIIARRNNIAPEDVSIESIRAEREQDSLRAINRRNTVLFKWYENSQKENNNLPVLLSREEYDSLKALPIITDYQIADHKEGLAPYFRESLRAELRRVLLEKDEKGNLKYAKANGKPYDIYQDGLRVYTTINPQIQKHAEEAVTLHLSKNIQHRFDANNRKMKNFPFDNRIAESTVQNLMNSAIKRTDRYRSGLASGKTEKQVLAEFEEPVQMKIFSWNGDIDTILTPKDSIRYYKNIMRAGLVSIEPQTGFIKAWVGGPNIRHFGYDHVAQGKRQVGSTIKPFIYSTGMRFGVIHSEEKIPNIPYCVDVQTGSTAADMTSWCPRNAGEAMNGELISFGSGLAQSKNNITVAVMARLGGNAGPRAVAKLMRDLRIEMREEDIVPAMCLGVMDLSLLQLTAAQGAFVNKGIYSDPTALMRIEDRHGNVIYEYFPEQIEVMSEDLAYATLDIMRRVVLGGTGGSLRQSWRDWGGIMHPTAGKTGTTQNNSDGWFMALTPDLVTGVWVGAEDMAVRFRSMEWGQGARMALPIYGYMMQKVYADKSVKISTDDFAVPENFSQSPYHRDNFKPKSATSSGAGQFL